MLLSYFLSYFSFIENGFFYSVYSDCGFLSPSSSEIHVPTQTHTLFTSI